MTTTPNDQDKSNQENLAANVGAESENTTPKPNPLDAQEPNTNISSGAANSGSNPKKKWDYSHYLLIATIVGAVVFLIYTLGSFKLPSLTQKIAVIDTRLLVMAVSVEVNQDFQKGNITLQQSESRIADYVDKMYKEAESYAANGYTVIPAQNVMFYSDKHDITEKIADELGVDYEAGLKALKDHKMNSTSGNVFQQNSAGLIGQNQQQSPQVEDHTDLDLQTNSDGQTSDLELFDGQ